MDIDENFIDCKCPCCGEAVSFTEHSARRVEKCPNCSEDLVVPGDGSEVAGKIPLPITTPRLVLRRLAPADWKDLLDFLSDEELFQYVDNYPIGEKQVLEWLDADQHVRLTTPNTTFAYDGMNRVSGVTRTISGSSVATGYGYDAANNVTSISDPNGYMLVFYQE